MDFTLLNSVLETCLRSSFLLAQPLWAAWVGQQWPGRDQLISGNSLFFLFGIITEITLGDFRVFYGKSSKSMWFIVCGLFYITVYIPWCQDKWCSTVHGFRICFDHNLHSHCYNDPGRLIFRIGWNHEPVMVATRHHPQIPLISAKIQLCDSWPLGLAGCNWDGKGLWPQWEDR